MSEGELWGGCQSGFVFCYYGAGEEEEQEEEKLMLCHYTQLHREGTTGVSAIVGGRDGLVWVGGKNGSISVWESKDGPVSGEEIKFSAQLLLSSKKSFLRRADSFFKLEYGELRWRKDKGAGSLSLKRVQRVREIEASRGGVAFCLLEDSGKERKFELEGEEGQRALDSLKFALFCVREKRVLERVGTQNLGRTVRALEMTSGRVWSFDDFFKVFIIIILGFPVKRKLDKLLTKRQTNPQITAQGMESDSRPWTQTKNRNLQTLSTPLF